MNDRMEASLDLKFAKFGYCKLTFINTPQEELSQLENTLLLKEAFALSNQFIPLGKALKKSQYGFTASAKDTGKHKLIRITDINAGSIDWKNVPFCDCKEYSKYAVAPGDILIARTGGTTGKTIMIGEDPPKSVFASYLIRLTADAEKYAPAFVYLFLNSYLFWNQILEMKNGTAQPNVNAEKMKNLLIPEVSLSLQKEIIDFKKQRTLKNDFFKSVEKKYKRLNQLYDHLKEGSSEFATQSTYLTQLRQAILQEAIEGKLTAAWRASAALGQRQSVRDENNDAAVLLEKIKAEKAKLLAAGKIKKEKPLPPIASPERSRGEPGEVPFALPEGWVWCHLAEVGINKDDAREPVSQALRERRKKIYPYYGASGIIDQIDGFTHEGANLLIGEDGANLVARSTPIAFLADGKYWVNNHAHVLGFTSDIMLKYICLHINAIDLKPYVTGGFQPKLSQANVNIIRIALPPLAEQQSIVEHVDKLLAMVDQLEKQVAERREQAEQLMQAVLREAFA